MVKLAMGPKPSRPPVNPWMTLNVCACAGGLVMAASMQISVMANVVKADAGIRTEVVMVIALRNARPPFWSGTLYTERKSDCQRERGIFIVHKQTRRKLRKESGVVPRRLHSRSGQ